MAPAVFIFLMSWHAGGKPIGIPITFTLQVVACLFNFFVEKCVHKSNVKTRVLKGFLVFTEEQLECLANWKDGSLRYMMGRVQHVGATSDEDRYRCFVYEKIQSGSNSAGSAASQSSSGTTDRHRNTILLAQSGDATCSGLTSPTEGSRTLKLTKGIK